MLEENPIADIVEDITGAYDKFDTEMLKKKRWEKSIKPYKRYKELSVKKYHRMGEENKKELDDLKKKFENLTDEERETLENESQKDYSGINNTERNAYKELDAKIVNIYNPKHYDDYYIFFKAVDNLDPDIKTRFISRYGPGIKKMYTDEQRKEKLARDFKGQELDVLKDWEKVRIDDKDKVEFSDVVQDLTKGVYTRQELQEANERAREEGRNEGIEEVNKQIEHAPQKITKIYENVENLNKTLNPEPIRDKEGNISPHSLLRNGQSLNKIQNYLSRGFGDLSQDDLMKKLKKETKGDDKEAKAYADAIMIRKTEQQNRNKPLYQRLKEARDANIIRSIPEEVQKDLNDLEREDFAKQMRDISNYYLLPHEWKTIKATREYGINPMLLRGIVK